MSIYEIKVLIMTLRCNKLMNTQIISEILNIDEDHYGFLLEVLYGTVCYIL